MLTWYFAFPELKILFQECWERVFVHWLAGLVETLLWVPHVLMGHRAAGSIPPPQQHEACSWLCPSRAFKDLWKQHLPFFLHCGWASRASDQPSWGSLGCGVEHMWWRRSERGIPECNPLSRPSIMPSTMTALFWGSAYTPENPHLNLSQLPVPRCQRMEMPLAGGKSVPLHCGAGCCFTHLPLVPLLSS